MNVTTNDENLSLDLTLSAQEAVLDIDLFEDDMILDVSLYPDLVVTPMNIFLFLSSSFAIIIRHAIMSWKLSSSFSKLRIIVGVLPL